MWKFILPAIGLVVVIIMALLLSSGQSDSATSASSSARMAKIALPENLPPMVSEGSGGGGDATEAYREAIQLYIEKADFLKANPPPEELIQQLVELIDRGRGGSVQAGWADSYAPLTPGVQPKWYGAPGGIAKIIIAAEVDSQVSGGEFTGSKQRARKAIDGVFEFGQHVYESNKRVLIRRDGLLAMEAALAAREVALGDKDAGKWRDAIGGVQIKWQQKLGTLYEFNVSIGDLVRFAELDQDPGFRVEAILQLGVAQWTQRSVGNARVATNSLKAMAGTKDPMIAAAAKAALALERKDVHKAY